MDILPHPNQSTLYGSSLGFGQTQPKPTHVHPYMPHIQLNLTWHVVNVQFMCCTHMRKISICALPVWVAQTPWAGRMHLKYFFTLYIYSLWSFTFYMCLGQNLPKLYRLHIFTVIGLHISVTLLIIWLSVIQVARG